MWNAASGGTLHQDVRENGRTAVSQNQLDYDLPLDLPFVLRSASGKVMYENRVVVARGSLAEAFLETNNLVPNSLHHQVVATPGDFRVVGTAHDSDTGKRSIEMTERWNGLTIQYHPEFMPSDVSQRRIYNALGRLTTIFRMAREARAEIPRPAQPRPPRAPHARLRPLHPRRLPLAPHEQGTVFT